MALKFTVQSRVFINPAAMASLTASPSGEIHSFVRALGNEAHSWALVYAPSRTGEIKRKTYSRTTGRATGVYAHLECSAPHAYWVHEGTDFHVGYMVLYGDKGRSHRARIGSPPTMGKIGDFGATAGKLITWRDGQTANPFLSKGLDAAVDRRAAQIRRGL